MKKTNILKGLGITLLSAGVLGAGIVSTSAQAKSHVKHVRTNKKAKTHKKNIFKNGLKFAEKHKNGVYAKTTKQIKATGYTHKAGEDIAKGTEKVGKVVIKKGSELHVRFGESAGWVVTGKAIPKNDAYYVISGKTASHDLKEVKPAKKHAKKATKKANKKKVAKKSKKATKKAAKKTPKKAAKKTTKKAAKKSPKKVTKKTNKKAAKKNVKKSHKNHSKKADKAA